MAREDWFASFAGLESCQVENTDFRRTVSRRASSVAIIAPHGGHIEHGTSEVAASIAADLFSLYRFEGLAKRPHHELHITSENFDEPQCLELIRDCDIVVAVHGRKNAGDKKTIQIGGRDEELRAVIAKAVFTEGFQVDVQGLKFPGTNAKNICNRGQRAKGVQLELPSALRTELAEHSEKMETFAAAVRQAIERCLSK